MQRCHREVVILKPTSVFLSFLAAQTSAVSLPDLMTVQSDTTAYTILRQDSEEETLDEIERHYSTMFRYEIARWLGSDVKPALEGSFLDFLCCFKFEIHGHIVLMEPGLESAHQLLCVKPRAVLLKWLRSAVEGDDSLCDVLDRVSLTQLSENATVVVKNFESLPSVTPFLQKNYPAIFEAEMQRMSDKTGQWPLVNSFLEFNRYFSVDIHTQLIHLF